MICVQVVTGKQKPASEKLAWVEAGHAYLEKTRRSPYFIMEVFQLRVINYGILLFFLLMVCNSSAMFVNVFTNATIEWE